MVKMRLDADEVFLPRARPPAYEKLERAHRELSKTVRHARWVQGVASHGWTDVVGSGGGKRSVYRGREGVKSGCPLAVPTR